MQSLTGEIPDRRHRRPLARQLHVAVPLVPVWAAGMAVMVFVAAQREDLASELLLDANQVAGVKWYTGIVTYLAVLSWCTAVVSASWGAWLCWLAGRRQAMAFLFSGAAITAYVMADDLLQLHAEFIPQYTPLGKRAAEALLVGAVGCWLVRYRGQISRTRWVVLIGAGAALVLSVLIDAVGGWGRPRLQLVTEDGAKLLGTLGWATYFVASTADIVRSTLSSRLGALSREPVPG